MVINTFEHEYPVSYVKEISDVSESYICRNTAKGGLCKILAISDRRLFSRLLPGLSDAAAVSGFTDFIEHFMYDGALCIVMAYSQGVTLKDKLATESLPLAEKLELARRVLERMILQELPDYYLSRCCSADCIIVESDMTLYFNYPIEDIEYAHTYTRADAMKRVADLLRFIFEKEAEERSSAVLSQFLAELPTISAECDLIELYSAYHEMMQSVLGTDAQSDEEASFWHQLWEKIKKLGAVLKRVLMFLLLAAAVLYLIFTIGGTRGSEVRTQSFERIGTVAIE